ncbi:response regulator [Phenylobacterium sp.]|uniref:response regulator n=1 Tax=Phenylobacterium sp. TaxID=1871053 RepID=UPI003D2A11E9
MSLPQSKSQRVNLSTAEVMLACGDPEGLNILAEMFAGFGVHTPRRCLTGAEARTSVNERILNLVVVDSALQDQTGYDFIHWLRRSDIAPNCYAPVILLTGHTKPSQIFKGRDAGASFVVRKPVAPMVMMQRILWLLNDQRKFVTSPGYCGPDRRVKALGPPVGVKGRRHDDLSAEVGAASTPNLEQDEIDALFKPKAIV